MATLDRLRTWARALKKQVLTVYLVARHPRTPWPAKAIAALTVAYALSPIDLIPDFIPVLGLVDDLLLIPLGLWLVLKLTPADVREDCAANARIRTEQRLPPSRAAAAVIAGLWLAAIAAAAWWAWPR
jgi:uncharacterized membrane protein YkvA (DUF1232 family)